MTIEQLRDRRVALWGFGREGRSTLAFLRREAPDLEVTILNDAPLPEERRPTDVEVIVGAANVLDRFDVVVKSPGVSLYRPEIERARRNGTTFTSATRLWFGTHAASAGAKTVAVTGTKGKSTTSSLVAHMLRAAGLRVELRGNIGNPLLDPADDPVDVWVIELSSYQTADLDAAVDVAVLLNLYPEHLDWHGDEETYYRDKINLLHQQKIRGVGRAVLNRNLQDDPRLNEKTHQPLWFDAEKIPDPARRNFPLRGRHNLANLAAALSVLDALDVDSLGDASESLTSFRGLPHRLYLLGENDGLLWVDDSISTTPQSAQAAIESFPDRPLTVLLGGYDRGIDYSDLARFLARRPEALAVTSGASGPRIAAALREQNARVVECEDLESATIQARRLTPAGGVVLLSPAAPSYDQFSDFKARGARFRELSETKDDEASISADFVQKSVEKAPDF